MDNKINNLKALVKQQNYQEAYDAGVIILSETPKHEYASYATAWAAARLGKMEECLDYIAPAIARKPDNFSYLSLRAHSYLALNRYAEALPDFQKMAAERPDAPAIWRTLIKIRAEFDPDLSLPRNLIVIADEMTTAYRRRDWKQCQLLLAELEGVEPITARYWQLLTDDFLSCLQDPLQAWSIFHQYACKRLADTIDPVSPLVDRNIAYLAFCNYFACLIKTGDTNRIITELPMFKSLYRRPCPANHVVAVAALLMRDLRHAECLDVVDGIEAELPNEAAKRNFRLKVYSSRWACRQALLTAAGNAAPNTSTTNLLSEGLLNEMLAVFQPGSQQQLALDDFLLCWKKICDLSDRLLLDVRFNSTQLATLKSLIKDALAGKSPFSLIRISDGDSYGFRDIAPELYSSQATIDIDRSSETIWWGRALTPAIRRHLTLGFLDSLYTANVIGFPGALRMARDLTAWPTEQRSCPSMLELKYRVLFSGMRAILDDLRIGSDSWWTDEFCNVALSDPDYIANLMETATSVVIVGCFDIPKGHLFDNPKVTVIAVPPARKVAFIGTKKFGHSILPDMLGEVTIALAKLAGPGVLALVSAGFAGKSLLSVAKQAGAVALDFGSGMDHIMGYQTRSLELAVHSSAARSHRLV
jgi:hypothetical protein